MAVDISAICLGIMGVHNVEFIVILIIQGIRFVGTATLINRREFEIDLSRKVAVTRD